MKTPPFEYWRVHSANEAAAKLHELGEDAKVIAGGQSLIPMLAFRLARPTALVDINGASDLDYVRRDGNTLHVGAMTRHVVLEHTTDRQILDGYGILPKAARWIGHYPIRTRGTVGGSLAHADGAAEWCLMASLLDAKLELQSVRGRRTVAADQWFTGLFGTVAEADELLIEVAFTSPSEYGTVSEFARRSGDFAQVAAAVAFDLDEKGQFANLRLVIGGVGGQPVRLFDAPQNGIGRIPDRSSISDVAAAAAAEIQLDRHRARMVRTMVERAILEALPSNLQPSRAVAS